MDTVNLLRHIYPAFQWHIVHAPLHPSNASLEEGGAVTIHYAEVPKGCVFVISVSLLNNTEKTRSSFTEFKQDMLLCLYV